MIRREDRQKDGRLSGRMIQLAVGTVWMPMVSHSVSGAGAVRSWGGGPGEPVSLSLPSLRFLVDRARRGGED